MEGGSVRSKLFAGEALGSPVDYSLSATNY